jgi:hypothetical protein
MTYALGRRLEKTDEGVVHDTVMAAKPDGYRFQDLILGIVNSAPFQMRQSIPLAEIQVAESKP